MDEWLIIEGAVEVGSSVLSVCLRHHGRDEWFPRAHVVHLEDGWHVKRWLAESRTKKRSGAMPLRKRSAFIDFTLLLWLAIVLPVAVAVLWIAGCNTYTNTSLRIERRANRHHQVASE